MHQKPKKLKNVKWNKNFGCPGRISFFAFFNTYMYLVSKNISPGLREFLVNQCLVSQGVAPSDNSSSSRKSQQALFRERVVNYNCLASAERQKNLHNSRFEF